MIKSNKNFPICLRLHVEGKMFLLSIMLFQAIFPPTKHSNLYIWAITYINFLNFVDYSNFLRHNQPNKENDKFQRFKTEDLHRNMVPVMSKKKLCSY